MHPLQEKIFTWYAKNKRNLPWRKTNDPYKILVSEVMLQQTQVDRVSPKYEAWLKKFPDVHALAKGSTADVLQYWSGLGYNNRALRLQKVALLIIDKFAGTFPQDYETLLSLPGVGPYTARALQIFAFNMDVVTIDTNIRRILIHELELSETASDKELEEAALSVLPKGKSCKWHNALMDYGALVQTARKTGIQPKSRQSKFLGSDRMFRGKIIKYLLAHKKTNTPHLAEVLLLQEQKLTSILQDLQKDGLIIIEKEEIRLP